MGLGTGDKGQKEETQLRDIARGSRPTADQAIGKAAAAGEIEQRRRDYAINLDKWRMGELGPLDVRNMPGADADLALYNDALKVNDAGRMGRGTLSMSGNVNPNFAAALGKEQEMERHKMASGALENAVNHRLDVNDAEMTNLYGVENQRNQFNAGILENRYNADQERYLRMLLRQRQPGFFKELALRAAQGAGQGAAAGSDSRLKDNVRSLRPVIDKLRQLEGVVFEWNDLAQEAMGYPSGATEGGVLADQVEQVFPQLVTTDSNGLKRVNYMALTGLLVEAVRSLDDDLQQLRAA